MAEVEQPRLAGVIRVERSPRGRARVLVDGVPLPWMVADPIVTEVREGMAPGVILTVLAERVEVIDAYLDDGEAKVTAEQHTHHLHEQVDTETPATDSSSPEVVTGDRGRHTRPEEVVLDLDADPDDADELARHEKLRERVISEVLSGQRPKARLKADR